MDAATTAADAPRRATWLTAGRQRGRTLRHPTAIDCRVLAFVLWASVGCGHDEGNSAFVPVPVSEIEQVTTAYDADIDSFKYLSPGEALPKLVALVDRVEREPRGKEDPQSLVMLETARQGRVDLVEALDAGLGSGARDSAVRGAIHGTLAEDWKDERMIAVRDRLARMHPDSLWLAPYRPGGVEFLFGVLEDPRRSIGDRVDSVGALSGIPWSAEVVKRLRALENDVTEVPDVRSLPVLAPIPTLGQFVRRAIKNIELGAPE